MRDKLKKFDIPEKYLNISNWEPISISQMSEAEKEYCLKKQEIIRLYFSTLIPIKKLCEEYQISSRELYLLIDRCLSLKEDGTIYGYSAILPHFRIKKRNVKKFEKFLDEHSVLQELIIKKFEKYKYHQKTNLKLIHKLLLNYCYKQNISVAEYPLNLSDKGYKALLRYYKSWSKEKDKEKTNQIKGLSLEQLATSVDSPLAEVEIDGHRIDAYFITEFQTPSGTWRKAVIERPWVICCIDRSTRCILSYELVLKSGYDSMDLISCLEKALIPQEGFPISENETETMFPNQLFPEVEYALFDELYLDNAKSHLSDLVLNTLVHKIGIKLCFSKVAEPTRRGIIERFFRTLEENSFHNLPSTTGSSPKDSRRNRPEEQARKFCISVQDLENILAKTIKCYNYEPHDALYGNSPIEDFQQKIEGKLYPYLPLALRDGGAFHTISDTRNIVANGVNNYLHINFAGAKYTSAKLLADKILKGKKLILEINLTDIRVIQTFYETGEFYDNLVVEKKWRGRKHSLKERKMINKLALAGKFAYLNQTNLLEAYDNYLFSKTKVSKKQASNIATKLIDRSQNLEARETSLDKKQATEQKYDKDLKKHRKLRGKPFKIKGINL